MTPAKSPSDAQDDPLKMDNEAVWLSIDVGTLSTRAMLFDTSGHELYQVQQPLSLNRLDELRVEQDAEQIADATAHVIELAGAAANRMHRAIRAAGMAVQRSSVVMWDQVTSRACSPVLSWQDVRANAWLQAQGWDAAELQQRTGLPLSPHYGGSKLRWLWHHVRPLQPTYRAGPLAGYLIQRLTQERSQIVDITNAARMQCVSLASPIDWDDQLLSQFEVPRDRLPIVQPSRYNFGQLAVGNPHVPLRLVCGDQFAAYHARLDQRPGSILVNLGTGGFVMSEIDRVPTATRLLCSPGPLGNTILEGTVNGAGAALEWAARQRQLSAVDQLPWSDWPWESRLRFVNRVGGLGSPWWIPGGRSYWTDHNDQPIEPTDDAAAMLAVLDSIAELVAANVQAMREAGCCCHRLILAGGLANIRQLSRYLSNRTGCPVERAQTSEATALGVAKLLASAAV